MVLTYRKIPDEIGRVMAAGLDNIVKSPTFESTHFSRALARAPRPAKVNMVTTLPVYNLGLSDVTAKRGLSSAVQTGWRSLLGTDAEVYAASDVHTNATSSPVFAQINTGPFVKGLDQALKSAHSDAHFGIAKYEVRVLSIPALYVTALWLVDNSGKAMIVPVDPCPAYLKANTPITEQDFISAISTVAQQAEAANQQLDLEGGHR